MVNTQKGDFCFFSRFSSQKAEFLEKNTEKGQKIT